MKPSVALRTIKVVHTIAWAFFAGCILAIPVYAKHGAFDTAGILIAVVLMEVLVLALNQGRCPLTGVAAHYTEDRRDNFDIYLPLWLARYNKHIFGSLFAVGLLYTLLRWQGWMG
ncbi:hypothetical protein [Longibacter sp.]|uniref:hypothetical protein n=1 Tax=Longibacter sp. TaxID=2045415 RepID=UPI003EBE8D23